MFVATLRSFCVALAAFALLGIGAPCAAAQPEAPAHIVAGDCPEASHPAPARHERTPVMACTFACAAVMPAPSPSGAPVRAVYPAEFSSAVAPLAGLTYAPRAPPPRLQAP